MIIILSPSKTLDLSQETSSELLTSPFFHSEASKLMKSLKKKKASDLEKSMKLSVDLSKTVKGWHNAWGESDSFWQAGIAMKGEAYKALDFNTLSNVDALKSKQRLFILSAVYGTLSPFDRIQPYRLEMAQKLSPFDGSKSLNAFWAKRLPQFFNNKAEELNTDILANLASDEYNKVVLKSELNLRVVNFSFKVETNQGLKNISVFAKQARGAMARYILENNIDTIEGLKGFNSLGFKYREKLSSTLVLTFTRTR